MFSYYPEGFLCSRAVLSGTRLLPLRALCHFGSIQMKYLRLLLYFKEENGVMCSGPHGRSYTAGSRDLSEDGFG